MARIESIEGVNKAFRKPFFPRDTMDTTTAESIFDIAARFVTPDNDPAVCSATDAVKLTF